MRQCLQKRLAKLERDVQARQAREQPAPSGHVEIFQEWLRVWCIERQPEESMAMAVARGMGIRPVELRDRLRALACA
jgi:hypothetical protein